MMRIAWFRPTACRASAGSADDEPPAPVDDTALLVRALSSRHRIDVIGARDAHDFVWREARDPYDVCVYELDNTQAHQFVWPYLVHYPGVVVLRCMSLQDSRADALERQQRFDDFAREFAFDHPGATPPVLRQSRLIAHGRWPMLRLPIVSSRVTVVAHRAVAEILQADYPDAEVRHVTPGVLPLDVEGGDVVIALEWPVAGAPLTHALAAFAAGRPVIVFDCTETADWPSIDPHDWRARQTTPAADPICVSLDPRDRDHSLRLAMRRLSEDAPLRAALGAAAREWWREHATVDRATTAFEAILHEARTLAPPPKPADWPAHMSEDAMTPARELLAPFGIRDLDFGT